MREQVFAYIKKQYKASPEYPWGTYENNAVFRHSDNKKWFALVLEVGRDKLGLEGSGRVDAVNLKIDDRMLREVLMQDKGILPAYHMNKKYWISILLDSTIDLNSVMNLLDESYEIVDLKNS